MTDSASNGKQRQLHLPLLAAPHPPIKITTQLRASHNTSAYCRLNNLPLLLLLLLLLLLYFLMFPVGPARVAALWPLPQPPPQIQTSR
jgi:hypothetical protein